MVTRESELARVLGAIAKELPDPRWVTLLDEDGLLVASAPDLQKVDSTRAAAVSAALVATANRVMAELEGGDLRYASVAGSGCHNLVIALANGRALSIGLPPNQPAQVAFGPLRKWASELTQVLEKRKLTS
jgi:predicted regulator of Ras-like GTPase activity (Roadblock/LC7/MglB family)